MVKYLNNTNSGFKQWRAAADAAPQKKSWLSSFLWWFAIFVACWWLIGVWMRPAQKNTTANADVAPVTDLSAVAIRDISSDKIDYDVQGLRISNIELKDFSASAGDSARQVLSLIHI